MKKSINFLVLFAMTTTFAQSLSTGLKAYYPFNGNALDSTAFGHDGTLMNGATFTTDRFGTLNSALLLDGVDDYVDIIATSALRPTNFPMTICAWIKPSPSLSSTGIIFANTSLVTQYGGQWLQVNTIISPQLSASYGIATSNTGPSSRATWRTNTTVCDNDWHFVSAVFNGINDIKVMVDCKYPTGYYDGSLTGIFDYPSIMKAVIGRAELLAQSPEYFMGAIDDVRFYDRALSGTELYSLCNQSASVVEANILNHFSVYFNNETNEMMISTPSFNKVIPITLSLTNMTGQKIWQCSSTVSSESKISYPMPSLSSGYYILSISDGVHNVTKKCVKY